MFKNVYLIFILAIIPFLVSCSILRLGPDCKIKSLVMNKDVFQVHASLYTPEISSFKNLIIVPPTGGTNYIDRQYAELFCRHGYSVTILDSWTGDTETTYELEIHQRFYSSAQKAIALVIQNLRVESAKSTIDLLGTSVGALHAIVAASVQKDLHSIFAIVGGVSIAEVIVKSDQEAMIKLREARTKMYGYKNEHDQIRGIQQAFKLDPMILGDAYQKKFLGVATATSDTTVDYETQKNLINFWHPTTIIENSGSHFWGILKTWLFHSESVLKFFEDHQPAMYPNSESKS